MDHILKQHWRIQRLEGTGGQKPPPPPPPAGKSQVAIDFLRNSNTDHSREAMGP